MMVEREGEGNEACQSMGLDNGIFDASLPSTSEVSFANFEWDGGIGGGDRKEMLGSSALFPFSVL